MKHGIPSTAELVGAVREFLGREVVPATAGRLSFHARVAANVLAQIERELHSGLPDTTGDAELCTNAARKPPVSGNLGKSLCGSSA